MADGGRNCFYRNGYKNAAKIYKRDRRNHAASPNSAQTEAEWQVRWRYSLREMHIISKLYEKTHDRGSDPPGGAGGYQKANRLMYAASILGVVVFGLLSAGIRIRNLR